MQHFWFLQWSIAKWRQTLSKVGVRTLLVKEETPSHSSAAYSALYRMVNLQFSCKIGSERFPLSSFEPCFTYILIMFDFKITAPFKAWLWFSSLMPHRSAASSQWLMISKKGLASVSYTHGFGGIIKTLCQLPRCTIILRILFQQESQTLPQLCGTEWKNIFFNETKPC